MKILQCIGRQFLEEKTPEESQKKAEKIDSDPEPEIDQCLKERETDEA